MRQVYSHTSGWPAFDVQGDIRRFDVDGYDAVAKRRPADAAYQERSLAEAASDRLIGLDVSGVGLLTVVVPEVVALGSGQCALVTPYLGPSLADDFDAEKVVPVPALRALLRGLLDRGVDAPGIVPRNLFARGGGISVIDWEDVRLGDDRPIRPSSLSTMKWDIAWSDVYRGDPRLRDCIDVSVAHEDVEFDEFELVLRDFVEPGRDVRAAGIEATLRSELYVAGSPGMGASSLGHLAEDILGPRLGVLHTALTAYARDRLGDARYAAFLADLSGSVGGIPQLDRALSGRGPTGETARTWLRSLCVEVDDCLREVEAPPVSPVPLRVLAAELTALAPVPGWEPACRRAGLLEFLLTNVAHLITSAFGLADLQLIVRGSLAQGVVSRRSDVDFELSSPRQRSGHRAAEDLVVSVLACFGFESEGSAGRPREKDIIGMDPHTGRDLHEWMELRRPGSPAHDPGWLQLSLNPHQSQLTRLRSEYEQLGREPTAKYLWFETRALLARLIFREQLDTPPVTIVDQLAALPDVVGRPIADEVAEVVVASFDLREQLSADGPALARLRDRLDAIRARLALPGPA